MYVKFEEGKKYTKRELANQEISDNLDDFDDAGYILDDSTLVVDIDGINHEQIQAMLDTFKIKTQTVWTDRGAHLYFKRPISFRRARGITALGFKVEYKHSSNTYAITVKRNGVAREVINEGVFKALPNYLQPIQSKVELVGLDEGDERNNALYAHKRKIHSLGNTYKILHFINNHLFEKPLDNDEFEVVARDETFGAEKDGENIVADTFMRDNKVVFHKGTLFFQYEGNYTDDMNVLQRLVYEYCAGQKTTYVNEVINQMLYRAEIVPDETKFKIKLKNGYLYEGEFYPYGYYDFTPYTIDINYDPNVEPVQVVDDYLNQLSNNDPDYRNFILEIIANSLITDHEFKRHLAKFFIFVGDGGNGKGTLLQIITKILGEKNVSANSIKDLSDEKYFNSLVGKLANLGDDVQDEPINRKEMKMLKNLSTGDRIQVRRLYENAFSIRLFPTLIFTSNHILKSFDKGYSYERRVVWCPMYTKPTVQDPEFISHVTTPEALQYWMYLIVEAYKRLYKNKRYTDSKIIQDFNKQYHKENNNTVEFMDQLEDKEIEGVRPPLLYNDYVAWCDYNGEAPLSKRQLRTAVEARGFKVTEFRRKAINNGHTYKAYRKISDIKTRSQTKS